MKRLIFIILIVGIAITSIYLFSILTGAKEKDSEFYERNWAYDYLDIDSLHQKYELKGNGVKVSLIDTGVSKEITSTVDGINTINDSKDYDDDHGHGTHIAGILSSEEFGVAPEIDLYVAKALDSNLKGDINNIINAIEWSIDKNVDVILMPFGTPKDNQDLKQMIDKAVEKDILVISSVGNFGVQKDVDVLFPAKYSNVIGVGAINKKGEIWKGTTQGDGLDVLLPGQFINSYSTTGENLVSSGTSMASAYMAGLASLYVQANKSKNESKMNEKIWKFMKENDRVEEYLILKPDMLLKEE
ncbi:MULTISPECIES: S8 family serine peptidase [Priestia]|uniref:S8 family serine peptidase n=1 Tax=Priestia TaxID=2800373 RepID=UPI00077C14D8|nr:S8 family serine peptidase [Priestia flexa]MED4588508.1 S8 family serine peptidase [Priestia flexa]